MVKKAKAKAKTKSKAKNNNLMTWVFVALFLLIVASIAVILTLNNNNPNLNEKFFVSDNSKYVATIDADSFGDDDLVVAYDVYYHNGNEITGHKAYYKYASEEVAKDAFPYYQALEDDEISTIELNGRFIVLIASPTQYEGLTLDMVKSWFDDDIEEEIDEIDEGDVSENEADEENVDTDEDVDVTETVEED